MDHREVLRMYEERRARLARDWRPVNLKAVLGRGLAWLGRGLVVLGRRLEGEDGRGRTHSPAA